MKSIHILLVFLSIIIKLECSNLMTDMEFENDLIKLLTKLHEKRVNEKIENENFINVNINNHYDLQDTLENAERYVEMYINEKGKFNNTIQSLSKKIDNQVEEKRNNFNNLKQKLDFVIEKSNNVQKDLNNKKSESLTLKSSYESIKPEYENYNLKLIDLISSVEKQITYKSQNYTEIKSQLSNIIDINKKRYKLEEKILKIKEDDLKYNHEYKNYKLLEHESTLDNNFLSAINDNLITNQKEIKNIKQNLTSEINKLSKLTNQNENINKLELEKSHFSEQYKETRKKYKELIKEQEEMELTIQELMKKKNKLNSNINAKEIENNLRINKKKNDLNEIQKNIKNVENELLNDIVKHKDFVLNNEMRIRQLIIILNKLLLNSGNLNNKNKLLDKVLFDNKKKINLENGVNMKLIHDINNLILKDN